MFSYHLPTEIVFGQPATEALVDALTGLAASRVLLVSDAGLENLGLVRRFEQALAQAGLAYDSFTQVETNPTTDNVHQALAVLKEKQSSGLVALGGGSPIDVAKAVAMLAANGGTYADYQWQGRPITERSLPVIAIPTTAGTGSEVSKVAVIVDKENPFKKGVLSPNMFAHTAILDPELTRSLPPRLTAATGIDALTHALEAYVGQRANPHTDLLAVGALQLIQQKLPQAVADGENMAARADLLLASLWAGTAMDHAGLGLLHALSGPLTGYLHLHHGLANGVILPYVLRFNLPHVTPARRQTLKKSFGLAPDAPDEALISAVTNFVASLGLPVHLSDLNLSLDGVNWDAIAKETLQMVLVKNNPRPVTEADCKALLAEMM
jgi:alcohol dehydrogenase